MWIQIPTPGDHYSPAYGSALITIIYEISKIHEMNGGKTRVIVGKGTKHDHDCGEIVEVDFPPELSRNQKIVDYGLERIGGKRLFGPKQYAPVLEAIPLNFDGPVFVHNNPVALRLIQSARPKAKVCLWANNELWRTYKVSEIQKIADSVHRLICCSEYIAGDLRSRIGDNHKIRVVNNGVNLEKFSPNTKLREAVPVIAFIGRMQPQKGAHLLLEAAKKIQQGRNFKVRIVGSKQFDPQDPLTPYEQELRTLSNDLGDKIEFLPAVDRHRVVEEFQKASIFCAPAVWNDPCPLTILEGMATGIPTVTTRRGGIPEMGGAAALYFDSERVDDLAQTLADLIDNEQKRTEIGYKSREQAEKLGWVNQYEKLLEALR